jgi:glycosyltransferase involved in cell wall biosynthesis
MATALEKYIYRNSLAITGQTEGIVEHIRRCVSTIPVELIPNGVDPSQFKNVAGQRQKMRAEFGFGDHLVVGYTGLHGLAQGLDTVLRAAEHLKDQSLSVRFVFFGDGPDKQRLRRLASAWGLTNVSFFPPQPADTMSALLSSLDVAIVPLRDLPLFRGALPSKLFECMAAKLPVVLAIGDGEACRLLRDANGGICVPPENAAAMARAVSQLASNPSLRQALGENGHNYVCSHYDRGEIAFRFSQLLLVVPRAAAATRSPIAS